MMLSREGISCMTPSFKRAREREGSVMLVSFCVIHGMITALIRTLQAVSLREARRRASTDVFETEDDRLPAWRFTRAGRERLRKGIPSSCQFRPIKLVKRRPIPAGFVRLNRAGKGNQPVKDALSRHARTPEDENGPQTVFGTFWMMFGQDSGASERVPDGEGFTPGNRSVPV